jgi:hypothetical protein
MLARKFILGFGLAVLMPMLIHYGIDVFVPRDTWREHLREMTQLRQQERETASAEEKVRLRARINQLIEAQQTKRNYSGSVHFFVGAPLGILVTILGSFIRAQAIGGGLMLGGIFTFAGGSAWYWADLSPVGRFLVLLVAFGVLLWIGYQRLAELKPKKSSG